MPVVRRRPSTLFPYTTLFRSPDAAGRHEVAFQHRLLGQHARVAGGVGPDGAIGASDGQALAARRIGDAVDRAALDRKSTRLNSSHITISYAVFCLKKKTAKMQ